MANLFQNASSKNRIRTLIWSFKLTFLSIGIISTVLLLKLAIPYFFNFLISTYPGLWISFRSWLSPPYLYILVNFIIITIAASSTLSNAKNTVEVTTETEIQTQELKQSDLDAIYSSSLNPNTSPEIWPDSDEKAPTAPAPASESSPETWSEAYCLTNPEENTKPDPSASAHFTDRRSAKSNRETAGRTGNSAAPEEEYDTLDATWESITGGKDKPATRHLKKSDTWDVPPRVDVADPEPLELTRGLKKSETFEDAAASASASCGLRREILMSHDELNRRVEAFIKKVNDDMRLQRQESDSRYLEMVNRSVY